MVKDIGLGTNGEMECPPVFLGNLGTGTLLCVCVLRTALGQATVILVADKAPVVTPEGDNLGWGRLVADGRGSSRRCTPMCPQCRLALGLPKGLAGRTRGTCQHP